MSSRTGTHRWEGPQILHGYGNTGLFKEVREWLFTFRRTVPIMDKVCPGQRYSTFFVRVPPDTISLQLCTPKVVGA
jgi:hypothetical protein